MMLTESTEMYLIKIYRLTRNDNTYAHTKEIAQGMKVSLPVGITPKQFLKEIRDRWEKSGKIPHEVGLALGYPVKDVLGYMGLLPLECMGVCGWRIYGDPAPSLSQCRKFTEAKQCAMIFLAA